MDADGLFSGIFKKTFQETLLIPVHAVERGNHKAIRNEGFHGYLNKVQNINSSYKRSLHQWFQGILFTQYDWNAVPVDRNDIAQTVVAIGRELPFTIDLSSARSREGNSEGQKGLYHFEAASPLLFIKIDLFNILVSKRRMRHRELGNRDKLMREFDTGDHVVIRKQVNPIRKEGIYQKLV